MMRITVRAMLVTAVSLGAVALLSDQFTSAQDAAKQRPANFEEARQRYERDLQRPSLFIRTRSAERMAAFREARGFELLKNRYLNPRDQPQDHVRYTTATILGRYYSDHEEFVDSWTELLNGSMRNADSFLWFRGQQARARHGKVQEVIEAITSRRARNVFLRATSLEAMASAGRNETLAIIPQLLGDRGLGRGLDRALLVEASTSALYKLRHLLGTDEYREAAEYVIRQLDERQTEQRTKLVIARHLKAIFNEPEAWGDAETWLRVLERGTPNQQARSGGQSGVRFMDVPAVGDRVAFVIDFSCSMLEPLTDREREELRGPTSGGAAPPGGPRDDLPWDRITNRFELAREELKRSLRMLPDNMFFCVIIYGTEVKLLDTTPRLVQSRAQVIRAVINELDEYRPGPPELPGRPYGRLLGNTNMHGALMKAFQVTDRIIIDSEEHVHPAGFTNGVDTIFHLSDGEPSWDNFDALDDRDPEDRVGDPETRTPGDDSATRLIYRGPYGRRGQAINYLVEDLRRMNLHRKVEIHNIGIGEFDPGLLEQISAIGMGTTRFITGQSAGRRR